MMADAEVQALSAAVMEAEAAHDAAIVAGSASFAAEAQQEAEVAACWRVLEARAIALAALPPATLTGAVAKARAAIALLPKQQDGELDPSDTAHLVAYAALEDLVRLVSSKGVEA